MMAKTLIHTLHQRNIVVQREGDELLITGDTDSLNEQDIMQIKEFKPQLLALLGEAFDKNATGELLDNYSDLVPGSPGQQYEAPVSNLQRNIYFLESLVDGQSFYNVPVAFRLFGVVNELALSLAVSDLCRDFHILRTVFRYQGDELKQVIQAFDVNKVPFEAVPVDVSDLQERLQQEANHRFDLASQWPLSVVLFNTGSEQVLSLTMHHIAFDGHSAKLMTQALSERYQSHLLNGDYAPTEDGIFAAPQYAQYASWHQQYLNSDAARSARKYWNTLLKDAPRCHNFPLEFTRSSKLSVEGDVVNHRIEGGLFTRLKQVSSRNNVSMFLLLQSLFAGFMARYGDEEDLVISSVYANRKPYAFLNTIGMFANTIPFRYRLDQNTDLAHLLNSTKTQHNEALKHQQYPFEMMLEGLQLERDPSYNPLVQVQLVLQEDVISEFSLADLEVEVVSNRQAVAKFDFSVHLCINQDSIDIQWEFNTNLFSKARLQTILQHYLDFIEHHLEQEFDKVLLFTFAQQNSVNEVSRSHFAPYLSNPEIIAQYANTQPTALAVRHQQKSLSYDALVAHGNRVIAGLQQRGIQPGESVAVYMEKSVEQVITMYAVMRGGFVYVPLDPGYPQERLAYICANANAKALIHSADRVPDNDIAGSTPLAAFETVVDCAEQPELTTLAEQTPAYIIYTSGSTGKPKGVVVPHGSIYYSLQANRKVYAYQPEDVMPTIGSQAFGVSLLETFVPLISGGTVEVLQKSDVTDIVQLIECTQQVSIMHMVPSLMAQWLDQNENNPALYPHLRLLLVGAEPVPPVLLKRLATWRPDVVVRVLYGMTESSVVSSGYLSHEHTGNGYWLGKPHPNMRFYAMNRFGVVQPSGVPGELYVGGLSLAQEYAGLPQLSAEKFGLHKQLNERLYKTGDRARLLPCGHFEFLGRVDHQVSLRGIRIETGEIESLVNQLDDVKKCIAHVVPLDNGDCKFVLYYTQYGAFSQVELEALIKAVLARKIPESMRPSMMMQLDSFPHNPNGKVDRTKLPKPVSNNDYVAAASDTEKFVQSQWCQMLELDEVSVQDNFFELGGHSLMATKLINRIKEHFAITLPLRRFFEAATVKDCARVIDEELEKQLVSQQIIKDNNVKLDGEIDEFVI